MVIIMIIIIIIIIVIIGLPIPSLASLTPTLSQRRYARRRDWALTPCAGTAGRSWPGATFRRARASGRRVGGTA